MSLFFSFESHLTGEPFDNFLLSIARNYVLACIVLHCLVSTNQYLFGINIKFNLFNKTSWKTCADPKSLFRGVPNLITFFFLLLHGEGRKDPNTTISGPSTARQRYAI